jgi:hypothetical protein
VRSRSASGEEPLQDAPARFQQDVLVGCLGNPGPWPGRGREEVALDDRDGLEVLGEDPSGEQAGHAPPTTTARPPFGDTGPIGLPPERLVGERLAFERNLGGGFGARLN